MGKKKREQSVSPPERIALSKEYSLAQAAQNLMIASHSAHKNGDTENLIAVSAMWLELSIRIGEEEDKIKKSKPIGFSHDHKEES